jgi:hypothetical protein
MRRIFIAVILFGVLLLMQTLGKDARADGITFTLGFESFPGKYYYRMDGLRYEDGHNTDYRYFPADDDINFTTLSLRIAKMAPIGHRNLLAGVEVGMAFTISDYEQPWDVPSLTDGFYGDVYFPGFC